MRKHAPVSRETQHGNTIALVCDTVSENLGAVGCSQRRADLTLIGRNFK
jgi:hypothetical protein